MKSLWLLDWLLNEKGDLEMSLRVLRYRDEHFSKCLTFSQGSEYFTLTRGQTSVKCDVMSSSVAPVHLFLSRPENVSYWERKKLYLHLWFLLTIYKLRHWVTMCFWLQLNEKVRCTLCNGHKKSFCSPVLLIKRMTRRLLAADQIKPINKPPRPVPFHPTARKVFFKANSSPP